MKTYKSFFIVWAGQVVSILGSSLSWFALGVWIYQRTGSASQFAMAAFCTALPQMLVSPFAGVLVDRFIRRWIMVIADGGAAFCTLVMLGLFAYGRIQLWNIYLLIAISAVKAATLAAYLVAGGLADRVIGPLLLSDGLLAASFGHLFGIGPGRGLALLFFLIGVVKGGIVLAVYLSPASRRLETRLGVESQMAAHTA